jgi:hypothetical protein
MISARSGSCTWRLTPANEYLGLDTAKTACRLSFQTGMQMAEANISGANLQSSKAEEMNMFEAPFNSNVYIPGYAGSQEPAEESAATSSVGFDEGSTKLRQTVTRDVRRHVFESSVIRLMKTMGVQTHSYVELASPVAPRQGPIERVGTTSRSQRNGSGLGRCSDRLVATMKLSRFMTPSKRIPRIVMQPPDFDLAVPRQTRIQGSSYLRASTSKVSVRRTSGCLSVVRHPWLQRPKGV